MRTLTRVHSPAERLALRYEAERADQAGQARFLAAVVLLRTGVTVLLPRTGAAGWWLSLLCALPGLAVWLALWGAMRLCRAATLSEAAAQLLGRWAASALGVVTALCLAWEGLACFTALVVLFTEGIGTAASPWFMALLTAAVLSACASHEGLGRGVRFLRWPVGLVLLSVLVNLAFILRADHLFPLLGEGVPTCRNAFWRGLGMGWPLVLLLHTPPVRAEGRASRHPLLPVLLGTAVLLLISLALPHELLRGRESLAESLLLAGAYLVPINRTLWLCLWMLGLGLGAAICSTEAARSALQPFGRVWAWLPGLLLLAMAATQLLGASRVQQAIGLAEPWLLAPFALAAPVLLAAALIKRRNKA